MLYLVQWDYSSSLIEGRITKGSKIDLAPQLAEAINRDSPGVLAPADQPQPAQADGGGKGKKTRQVLGGVDQSPPIPPEG